MAGRTDGGGAVRAGLRVGLVMLLVAQWLRTLVLVPVWASNDTLWAHAVTVRPTVRAHVNYSKTLFRQGRMADVGEQLALATRLERSRRR